MFVARKDAATCFLCGLSPLFFQLLFFFPSVCCFSLGGGRRRRRVNSFFFGGGGSFIVIRKGIGKESLIGTGPSFSRVADDRLSR